MATRRTRTGGWIQTCHGDRQARAAARDAQHPKVVRIATATCPGCAHCRRPASGGAA